LSIEIAQYFKTEIISCDSRQMYRELKIGVASPEEQQLQAVQHHFIGHISIHDYFSAGEFEKAALYKLEELFQKHDYVVMTGGSGLYVDAVTKGIDNIPKPDDGIRAKYLKLYAEKGIEHLQELVKEIDPDYYAEADLNNSKRLLKCLETYDMTGKPLSVLRTNTAKERDFKIVQIGLQMDRELLYERIDMRVDLMLRAGLVEEAKQFYEFKHLNSLNTVGYKELYAYFGGEIDYDDAVRLIKRNSRRYAKRQISWFNRDKTIKWFNPKQKGAIIEYIGKLK